VADAPEIPYEQARDELISVVQKLETGGTSLDESLALWERGELLAKVCQQWLDGARSRLAAAAGVPDLTAPDQTVPVQEADNDET